MEKKILYREEIRGTEETLNILPVLIDEYMDSGDIDQLSNIYKEITEIRKVIGTALSSQRRYNAKLLKEKEGGK